jgi:hypothetical protein
MLRCYLAENYDRLHAKVLEQARLQQSQNS